MVNKIKAKRFELDVSCIDDTLAHINLIKLLKKNELFSTEFLYRGTGQNELRMLKGLKAKGDIPRNISTYEGYYKAAKNSIDCYTIEDMKEILIDSIDKKSPVSYATGSENPIILVYHAKCLEFLGNRSNFEYSFRDFNKRADALAAIVGLI